MPIKQHQLQQQHQQQHQQIETYPNNNNLKAKYSISGSNNLQGNSENNYDVVPIPIQFFFWNQTSLFIRHKFGPLTESHATNFERVLVQNILHGLSPGLSNAISSISRWTFIKASFPHIIHACAAALTSRIENNSNQTTNLNQLTKTETKLLYTLHWLILDAASECEDNAVVTSFLSSGQKNKTASFSTTKDDKLNYLHSVATIQLFVYFFIPILKSLKRDDFDNLKLSNGLKIWEALWAHRQPDIKMFNTPVKQKYQINRNVEFIQEKSATTPQTSKQLNSLQANNWSNASKKSAKTFDSISAINTDRKGSSVDKSNENSSSGNEFSNENGFFRKVSHEIKSSLKMKMSLTNNDKASMLPMPKSSSCLDDINKMNTQNSYNQDDPFKLHVASELSLVNSNDNNTKLETDSNKINLSQNRSTNSNDTCSMQISDIDNDRIRDSTSILNKKISYSFRSNNNYNLNMNNINSRAPIVHMSSICSFSIIDESGSGIASNLENRHLIDGQQANRLPFSYERSKSDLDRSCLQKEINGLKNTETNEQQRRSTLFKSSLENISESVTSPKITPRAPETKKALSVYSQNTLNNNNADSVCRIKLSTSIRDATFFDVAVLRCLLSPKWHMEGYIWALEYLSYRVTEITDFTLKEQDNLFKFRSPSLPSDLNDLFVLMGVGSVDEDELNRKDKSPDEQSASFKQFFKKTSINLNNDFFELINQINLENDYSFKNRKLDKNYNIYDYTKRRNYEANFQTRIRRMKYIDDDLQYRKFKRKQIDKKIFNNYTLTTAATFSIDDIQKIDLNKRSCGEGDDSKITKTNIKPSNQKYSKSSYLHNFNDWSKDFDQKFNFFKTKINKLSDNSPSNSNDLNGNKNSKAKQNNLTNLNRELSVSDTEINYQASYEEMEEAAGSAGLINLDGSLNLNMILKGVHSVILKENSSKLCDLTLNILENLMNIDILPSEEIDEKLKKAKQNKSLSQSSHAFLDNLESKYNENFHLASDLVLRNVKWLGCVHCKSISKNFLNDQLRGKVKLLLNRLHKKNSNRFRDYFKSLIKTSDINYLMEIFHAMFGFCNDPLSGYSHYFPYISLSNYQRNSLTSKSVYTEAAAQTNEKPSIDSDFNIDSIMVEMIFRPLIDRLIELKNEIKSEENLYLFSDIKNLISFVKENHGGIFRKIAFSCMLEPYIKIKQETHIKSLKLKQIDAKLTEISEWQDLLTNLNLQPSQYLNNINENDDAKSLKIGGKSNGFELDQEVSMNEYFSEKNTLNIEEKKINNNIKRSFKLPNHLKNKNKLDSNDTQLLQMIYDQTLNLRKRIANERIFLKSNILARGLEYYRFLIDCLPPAAIPDVPFMSALLELEAPIISKAAFLLETAYFVHRCNRKDWPESIKNNIGILRPYGSNSNFKSLPNVNRRNKVYQLAAANMFAAWGEVLANKLEGIIDENRLNEENNLNVQDYFNDSYVNPKGNNCPFALQNVVCMLLLEITKFLRETYQYMPKKIGNPSSAYRTATATTITDNHITSQATSGKTVLKGENKGGNVSSLFSNESSNHSGGNLVGAGVIINSSAIRTPPSPTNQDLSASNYKSHYRLSTDNISLNQLQQENENCDIPRHISFAIQTEKGQDTRRKSLISITNLNGAGLDSPTMEYDENAKDFPHKKKLSFEGDANQDDSPGANNQSKRSSVSKSAKRTSLKYRDRSTRSNQSGSNPNYSVRRRVSKGTLMPDDRREESHVQIHEDLFSSNTSDNNIHSNFVLSGVGVNGSRGRRYLSNVDSSHSNTVEVCEVDEVDFNRCFPWIKVVIKMLSSINYNCKHFNPSESTTTINFDKCSKDCYLKLYKGSYCLIEAVLSIYEIQLNANESSGADKKDAGAKTDAGKAEKIDNHRASINKYRKPSQFSINSNKLTFVNNILKKDELMTDTKSFEKLPTLEYLLNQVQCLNQIPLLILCKSVLVMTDDYFINLVKISWNLLLDSDQEIASSAATLFIIGAIKQSHFVEEFLSNQLRSSNSDDKYTAILKFESLWKFRYHVWPRLENNANIFLKISPPSIEFVLPSPPIGIPFLQIVDPPWMPKAKTKVEEVTVNQEEVRAVVTASKSRKKHQQEIIHRALQADSLNKKIARENFNFTDISYLQNASFEPFLHQSKQEEQEEVVIKNEETETQPQMPPPQPSFSSQISTRRQSIAPLATKRIQTLQQNTIRKSIVPEVSSNEANDTANANEIQQSQPVFPSSLSSAVLCLIDLLSDFDFNSNNQSISALVRRIVWNCLTEDATLFLRYFFEKITQKDKKKTLIQYLSKLINVYSDLSPQTAYVIFNYLLGVVMFHVRTTNEGSQEAIASIQTILWRIVSNVNGIVFKDLKQTLRKEQCDPSLLVTANVPSAKKLIVHGPDLGQIPTQCNINDNTQFSYVIQESLEFFSIPESKKDRYFLFDIKTDQIHIPDTYVRNFYFFRRNFYPQLTLVQMDPKDATKLLEKAAFHLKSLEQSKVLFFRKLLESTPFNQVNTTATFLHEELIKLPAFPRKALEADFNLFPKLTDRELLTTDMLHKYSWCQLIWSLFSSMNSKTTSLWDISVFLNVVNGSFILHCEDLNMIRTCLAIYINSSLHFQHIFATNGFLLIIPTLMKVYSNMQSNHVVKNAIEFSCLQFYIMHRIPFILQLFGSVAKILDLSDEKNEIIDTNKVQSSCLFNLLLAMETSLTDNLRILEIVKLSNCDLNISSSSLNLFSSESTTTTTNTNQNLNASKDANMNTTTNLKPSMSAASQSIKIVASGNLPNEKAALSSPANLLTNAGSTAAVLAVSGMTATNLIITNSGALGIQQLPAFNTAVNSIHHVASSQAMLHSDQINQNTTNNLDSSNLNFSSPMAIALNKGNQNDSKNTIRPLDFCYMDEQSNKFSIRDSINLCVTVVAYGSHAQRSNQMLTILDIILPRYLSHLNQETSRIWDNIKTNKKGQTLKKLAQQEIVLQAKSELITLQKITTSIKTLVNISDFITRNFTGAKSENTATTTLAGGNSTAPAGNASNLTRNTSNRSPSIVQDDDSVNKLNEEKKPKSTQPQLEAFDTSKQDMRLPQDVLLNIVSNFVDLSSKRIKELYKTINDSSLKVTEPLDTKAHYKLLEVAHILLKLWDDPRSMNGEGLQNYFKKLLPATDWTQDDLKQAFNNFLRRIDRTLSKITKKPSAKKQSYWPAIAGILEGLFLTLDKYESISSLPYFKIMINTVVSLISNELSTDLSMGVLNNLNSNWNSNRNDFNFQMPILFSKSLIKLVGRYVNALKDQFNLEHLFGGNNMIGPTTPNGLVYLINFLMPLLFWSASNKKDSPKLNRTDMSYVTTMVLNSIKPPSKLAASLLLTAPKQHHLASAFDSNITQANNIYNKSARQIKDIINQSVFLALKLVVFSFSKQCDLSKISTAIRQVCSKAKTIYLWKFLEFIVTNRTPIYLLLKPFIENFIASQNCETDAEIGIRNSIQSKLNCSIMANMKCTNMVLAELIDELNAIKIELQDYNEMNPIISKTPKYNDLGIISKTRRATMRIKKKISSNVEESKKILAPNRKTVNSNHLIQSESLQVKRRLNTNVKKASLLESGPLKTKARGSSAKKYDSNNFYHLRKTKRFLESHNLRSASFNEMSKFTNEKIILTDARFFRKSNSVHHFDLLNSSDRKTNIVKRRVLFKDTFDDADSKPEQKTNATESDSVNEATILDKKPKEPSSPSRALPGTSNTTVTGGPTSPAQATRKRLVFNKSKKDTKSRENGGGGNVSSSPTTPPRKKLEILNYKTGIDILEAYREKHKSKLEINIKESINSTNGLANKASSSSSSFPKLNSAHGSGVFVKLCHTNGVENNSDANKKDNREQDEKKIVEQNDDFKDAEQTTEKDQQLQQIGKVKKIVFV